MSYKCEITEQSAQATLSIRTTTTMQDLAQVVGNSYCAIAGYLEEIGVEPVGPPFAIYNNEDMEALDIEVGFPVSGNFTGKDDIKASELPAGKVATYLYTGPYNEMEPVYSALMQWLKDNGYKVTGVMREMCLNDLDQVPLQEVQTRIVFLLKST